MKFTTIPLVTTTLGATMVTLGFGIWLGGRDGGGGADIIVAMGVLVAALGRIQAWLIARSKPARFTESTKRDPLSAAIATAALHDLPPAGDGSLPICPTCGFQGTGECDL